MAPEQPEQSGHLFNQVSFWSSGYLGYLLFSEAGRINRKKFIAGFFFLFLLFILLLFGCLFLWGFLSSIHGERWANHAMIVIGLPLYMMMVYCGLIIRIKRMHDLGFSGVWLSVVWLSFYIGQGVFLIPGFVEGSEAWTWVYLVLGLYLLLASGYIFVVDILCFFVSGTKGNNRYGPDPIQ